MRKNKVRYSIILSIMLILGMCTPVMAEETTTTDHPIELLREYSYYDAELDAYVIAFTRNADDSVNYLSQNEAEELEESVESMPPEDEESSENVLYDYREWHKFVPSGSKTHSQGKRKKVSADFEAPRGGGSITKKVSFSISHSFSANVDLSSEKLAIQSGCGFNWVKSVSSSTEYTAKLKAGEKGYLSFTPYYNKISGTLQLYSNWDGLLSKEAATGYSVKKTADGEPDGLYKFIYK